MSLYKQNSGQRLLAGGGAGGGTGSHSHNKRFQFMQQQAQRDGSQAPVLSGIPTNQQYPGDSSLGPNGSTAPSDIGSDAFQFANQPRSSTGYFSQGGVSVHGVQQYPGSFQSYRQASTVRSGATGLSMSRSLGASKASLASYRSGKTSIQQEYRDLKVQRKLMHPCSGEGRVPFTIAIICFVLFFLVVLAGVVVMILRAQGTLFLSLDKGDLIGPLLIAGSFIFLGIGATFAYSAYRIRNREVRQVKYRAASASMVSLNAKPTQASYGPQEKLKSGSATQHAITRTPLGSRSNLQSLA